MNFPPTFLHAAATWRTTTPFFELQHPSTSASPSIIVPVANLRVGIFAKEGKISHTFIYIEHFSANFFASNHMFPPWLPSVIIIYLLRKKSSKDLTAFAKSTYSGSKRYISFRLS